MSEAIKRYEELLQKISLTPNETIPLSDFNKIAEGLGFKIQPSDFTIFYMLTAAKNITFSLMNKEDLSLSKINQKTKDSLKQAKKILEEKIEERKNLPDNFILPDGWDFIKEGKTLHVFHNFVDNFRFTFQITGKESNASNFNGKFDAFADGIKVALESNQAELLSHPILKDEYFKCELEKNDFGDVTKLKATHKIYEDLSVTIDNSGKAEFFSKDDFANLTNIRNLSDIRICSGIEVISKLEELGFDIEKLSKGPQDKGLDYTRYLLSHPNFNQVITYEVQGGMEALDLETQNLLEKTLSEFERRNTRHKKYNSLDKWDVKPTKAGLKKTLFLFDTNTFSNLFNANLMDNQKLEGFYAVNYGASIIKKLSEFNTALLGTTETIVAEHSGEFPDLEGKRIIHASNFEFHHTDFGLENFKKFVADSQVVELETNKILQDGNSKFVLFRTNTKDQPLDQLRFNYRDKDMVKTAFKQMRKNGFGEDSIYNVVKGLNQDNIGTVVFITSDRRAGEKFMELQQESKLKLATCNAFALVDALCGVNELDQKNKSCMYKFGFKQGIGATDFHAALNNSLKKQELKEMYLTPNPYSDGLDLNRLFATMNALNRDATQASIAGYGEAYKTLNSIDIRQKI